MPFNDNLDFTHKLNRLIEQTKLLKTKYASIIIYGYGTVGRLIAPLLKIKLVGIVDQAATGCECLDDVRIEKPEALSALKADCVVVTVLGREEEITDFLRNKIGWQGEIFIYTLKKTILTAKASFTKTDRRRMAVFKSKFDGKRCVIIGNGPSLNRCDLSRLREEFTFGVNGIFYKTEEMGFKPTFYVVEDSHVIEDNIEAINAYECDYKYFPAVFKGKVKRGKNTYFFEYDCGFYQRSSVYYNIPRFSFDAAKAIYAGQTVTYTNLQLAVFMGFVEIYLVGVDFSYSVPKTTEIIGDTYISNEDDPNHFHPAYFGKGKKWHDPKLDRVLMNFHHAKALTDSLGVRIFNATKGGELELFPRVDYDSVFDGSMKH